MQNNFRSLILIFVCFTTLLTFLQGQNNIFSYQSDSLLFENDVKATLQALNQEIEFFQSESFNLKKKYLQQISQYASSFDEELFPVIRTTIDEILNSDQIDMSSKRTYLNHFINAFSRRILKNNERIKYSSLALNMAPLKSSQDTFFALQFLFHRGSAKSEDKMIDEALLDLEEAEKLSYGFDNLDKNIQPKILYYLGVVHKEIGSASENIGYEYLLNAEQSLLELEHPDTVILAGVYGMLSDIAWNVRDYEKGLNYVRKYKEFHNQLGATRRFDPVEIAEGSFHIYYKEMQFLQENQVNEGLKLVGEAESKFGPYKDNIEIKLRMAATYNMMGELYIRKDPSKSVPYYKKAIQALNDNNSTYYLQYLFNLGKACLYGENVEESLIYSSELIEKGEMVDDSRLPFFYFLKAFAYIKLQDLNKALDITNDVILYMDPSCNIDLVNHTQLKDFSPKLIQSNNINLLSRMGLEFMNGFPDNPTAQSIANALFQLGISEYGKSIRAAKVTFYTKSMYEQLSFGILQTSAFLKEGDLTIGDLIAFSENTNEKYLWTNHKDNNDPSLFFDEEILKEENKWREKLILLKQKALTDSSDLVRDSIFDIELKLEKIIEKKKGSNASYFNFEEAEFSFEEFKSELEDDVAVLKYEFIMDSLFLFKITSNQTVVQSIPSKRNLKEFIEAIHQMISNPQSPLDSLNQSLETLGAILIPELDSNIKKLIIQYDGALNLIPFDLLRSSNRYLIEDYTISYVTALGLYHDVQKSQTIRNALVIAPSYESAIIPEGELVVRGASFNLTGALEEAGEVGEILNGKVLLEDRALKSSFKKSAKNYDLLHFSMHSLLNDIDPELSNLAFYDGEEDNKLYINELYGMQLNAHMAVLSACNTGIGKEETGEGIVSLNRAFTFAGVPSVVSSLWSAPDKATREIMVNFYENLKSGSSKPDAMRAAKLSYLENQKVELFKHPFYWAGFVSHGNTSPLEISGSNSKILQYVLIGGLLILVMGWILIRKRKRLIA